MWWRSWWDPFLQVEQLHQVCQRVKHLCFIALYCNFDSFVRYFADVHTLVRLTREVYIWKGIHLNMRSFLTFEWHWIFSTSKAVKSAPTSCLKWHWWQNECWLKQQCCWFEGNLQLHRRYTTDNKLYIIDYILYRIHGTLHIKDDRYYAACSSGFLSSSKYGRGGFG